MQYFQIEYFLGIVRNGTMNAAAKALNISQSSLSSALKNLEKELGTPLFDRVGRKLVLNESGKYFLQQAEKIEGLFRETIDTLQRRTTSRSNTINCALHTPIGNPGVLVAGFKKLHPNYTLRIGFLLSGAFGIFSEDDVDINIIATPLHLENDKAIFLGTEEYAMALPCDHPLAIKETLNLSDFKDENFIVSIGGKSISCFDPDALCQEAGFDAHIVCAVQQQNEAMQLVEAGVGCCIVPEYTWLANESYNITLRHFSDIKHHRHLYAQLATHKQPSIATLSFIEYLKDYAKDIQLQKK